MTNYRERIVRRAARTAARQTMLLKRVNEAFGDIPTAADRTEKFRRMVEEYDSLNNKRSVYNQPTVAPIVQSIPTVIADIYGNMNEGR